MNVNNTYVDYSFLLIQAPISFFDTNPMGRIINRFSSDLYSIDDSLPFILNIFLAQLFGILGTVVVICFGLPWFTLLLLPLGAVYHKIQVKVQLNVIQFFSSFKIKSRMFIITCTSLFWNDLLKNLKIAKNSFIIIMV